MGFWGKIAGLAGLGELGWLGVSGYSGFAGGQAALQTTGAALQGATSASDFLAASHSGLAQGAGAAQIQGIQHTANAANTFLTTHPLAQAQAAHTAAVAHAGLPSVITGVLHGIGAEFGLVGNALIGGGAAVIQGCSALGAATATATGVAILGPVVTVAAVGVATAAVGFAVGKFAYDHPKMAKVAGVAATIAVCAATGPVGLAIGAGMFVGGFIAKKAYEGIHNHFHKYENGMTAEQIMHKVAKGETVEFEEGVKLSLDTKQGLDVNQTKRLSPEHARELKNIEKFFEEHGTKMQMTGQGQDQKDALHGLIDMFKKKGQGRDAPSLP